MVHTTQSTTLPSLYPWLRNTAIGRDVSCRWSNSFEHFSGQRSFCKFCFSLKTLTEKPPIPVISSSVGCLRVLWDTPLGFRLNLRSMFRRVFSGFLFNPEAIKYLKLLGAPLVQIPHDQQIAH